MVFYSPLRYPGGKQKLAKFIDQICIDNDISGHYVEPYAGGASVALYLLLSGRVNKITINDFDEAIYSFWWSVLYRTEKLCRMISDTDVTVDEWHKQKKVLITRRPQNSKLKLGFAALFLNRTNYSGVLKAGPIGGVNQNGRYKIDCRFNKIALIEKIRHIATYKDKIHVSNMDALDLIDGIEQDDNTIFYFDPPYYEKGPSLYMNHYKKSDHDTVSRKIQSIAQAQWIVSYDSTPEIDELYANSHSKTYELNHCAHINRVGKESLFFSRDLIVCPDAVKRYLRIA